jgi:hypothetical protein
MITVVKSSNVTWAGHTAYGRQKKCVHVLVVQPKRKEPVGRPTRRRDDNFKMDLRGLGWEMLAGLMWLRIGTIGGFF